MSCQKNWSNNEIQDFLYRCKKANTMDLSEKDKTDFCECILEESLELKISYSQFLKTKLSDNQNKQIINPCID